MTSQMKRRIKQLKFYDDKNKTSIKKPEYPKSIVPGANETKRNPVLINTKLVLKYSIMLYYNLGHAIIANCFNIYK